MCDRAVIRRGRAGSPGDARSLPSGEWRSVLRVCDRYVAQALLNGSWNAQAGIGAQFLDEFCRFRIRL
jgi:hypothetical protein